MSEEKSRRSRWLVPLIPFVIVFGLLAAIAVPNLLTAMNRSHEKRTMADMRTIATAWEARANDFNTYDVRGKHRPLGALPQALRWDALPPVAAADLERALVPKYIKKFPRKDGWEHDFEFVAASDQYAIRSRGRDGKIDGSVYAVIRHQSFDNDIVYGNGSFYAFPEGL